MYRTLVYKTFTEGQGLETLPTVDMHGVHLRSEGKGPLDEPRTRLNFGDRAFSISAPRLWNALPQHLKDSTSGQAFKKCFKTHLFRLAH